ncbi:GntR family transcriptional regulator [Brevibacillus fluminis]|nr:GntR family transcriptional regulator [Brevibacillus fluminis]
MEKHMGKEWDTVPFYKQLKDKIAADIASGQLKQGDKLPSERDLADQFQISRMTARNAIAILEREGFVERRIGVGTFIARQRIEMDFVTFNSFTKTMLEKGLVPGTKKLHVRKDKAQAALATQLGIEEGEEIIVIRRLRMANAQPMCVEESLIPYRFCPGIEAYIADDVSLYRILEEQYGIVLIGADQYMQVVMPDEEERKLLKIKKELPCLLLEAIAYEQGGRAIEYSRSTTRSDRVKFYTRLNLDQ